MSNLSNRIGLAHDVADRLTYSGVPARCDVVEGDVYVRLDLTHDGSAMAWVPLDDPTHAFVRDQPGGAHRIEPAGPLERGWEACSDVDCLAVAVWVWVLQWRSTQC